jgi:hypothetical protein
MRTAVGRVRSNAPVRRSSPGRRYTRAWIRDGAIMAAALLRVGCPDEALAFVRWYAGSRLLTARCRAPSDEGADWLVEHDSHGELVFRRWPRSSPATASSSTRSGRTCTVRSSICCASSDAPRPEWETAEKRALHGLLPESASHEGYLAHPVHAYWDDFWAIRALGDAAYLAEVRGDLDEAARLTGLRDDFRESVRRSIATVIAARGIGYVPGSVEWADFDPTATSNAVSLLGETALLPPDVLAATWYLKGFRRCPRGPTGITRVRGRIIGALVCPASARVRDCDFSRRPPTARVEPVAGVSGATASPGHIERHAAPGSAPVRLAVRTMLAYERPADDALVVAAGVPGAWLERARRGRDLPTYHGTLASRSAVDARRSPLPAALTVPAGGIVVRPPLPGPLVAVELDGSARLHV